MYSSHFSCSFDGRGSDIVVLSTTARYKADVSAAEPQIDTQFRWDGSPTVCQPGDYEAINRQHQCILQDEPAEFSKRAEELTCTLSSMAMWSILSPNTVGDDGSIPHTPNVSCNHLGETVDEDVRVTLRIAVSSPRKHHHNATVL
ncbi:hypothetical protein STCU_09912 [Strigomonas culicis]|uniref:Uncharacterized protein n=1 Tax=Strigomonas culicis TaxID=28005 RepID=S9TJV8_9TRYP|nr:hypothetical protein STCU_09912 [Strigomonas culicis]|eukprot:EPY18437.1 hypothetical protein STCU_09912 [Strigomonas culicis]